MKTASDPFRAFVALVLSVLLIVLVGYLLVIGKSILLPIFIAVISVYVLVAASETLGRVPILGRWPGWVRRLLVLLAFLAIVFALASVVIGTAQQVIDRSPFYQQNLESLVLKVLAWLGIEREPNWQALAQQVTQQVNMQKIAMFGLGSVSSLLGVATMVAVYAAFLMGERNGFAHKIATALPGDSASQTQTIVRDINQSIGDYLAVKTLVNVILAAMSYAVLWVFGVDFALFWAILIGLLNYIPYVGSLLGVVFPVLLTMAQFGEIQTTLLVAVLLTAAQAWVGNVLEPRMIGKKVNMSPFVVLVALSVWSSLWGISGAILAIPLTSIIAIVMSQFAATRPLAILLADDVSSYEGERRESAA